MTNLATTNDIFYNKAGLDKARVEAIVRDAVNGSDDGEMFLEYCQSEGLTFDDGKLKAASFDTSHGFGLRAVAGEATGYAHASNMDEAAMRRAANSVRAVADGYSGTTSDAPDGTNHSFYIPDNPLAAMDFEAKVKVLQDIDAYARGLDDRVRQVSINLSGEWQAVQIVRGNGFHAGDIRPLVRLSVSVILEQDGRMESGSYGTGGRTTYDSFVTPQSWKKAADEAYRQAVVNLESIAAPAAQLPVVLGPGWPGILLHEAIGHGLEGDFNRKKTSAFSELMGQRIAAPGVTVIDDGTYDNRRGSITIDDEGTPGQCTTLIEDGILTGYLFDRMNARLMGKQSTGNGRRQSHAHSPIPRMTNTIMMAGTHDHDEIISSVDKGVYAVTFGGGQVDITSGKFVFSCTEAYEINDGKIGRPLKGATLIGNGPDVLSKISMIGNNMELDPGIGTCGKDGQGVPVGVGQPTILLDELTIGGAAV